jgi:hypothetical protein
MMKKNIKFKKQKISAKLKNLRKKQKREKLKLKKKLKLIKERQLTAIILENF